MNISPQIKKLSKYIAILSATVMVLVSMLLVVNHLQIKTYNPIESDTIDNLVKKLDANPDDNELREQIRMVDLMARKAYFSSVWQLRTGAWIILASFLMLVLSVRIYTSEKKINAVLAGKQNSFWELRSKERNAIMLSVGVFAVVALMISLTTDSYYSDFRKAKSKGEGLLVANEKGNEMEVATVTETLQLESDSLMVEANDSISAEVTGPDFPSDAEIRKNHPGFRGPYGLGTSYKTRIPTDWNGASGKNIVWKKSIPLPGLNSPVIWENYLFVAGANATTRKVYCYNRLTGALLWEKEIKNIPGSPATAPKVTSDTGHSASGMTTDGKRVYVIFSTGDIASLDFGGDIVWAKNLGVPDNHYGHSSSLQFFKDKLIVQYDDNKACRLIALSTQTGAEIWTTRREGQISWSSPIIVPKGNSAEIIVNNLPFVASYNVENGRENWRISCLSGEIGPSPAYGNGMVFVANEYAKMVAIKDGKVVWENFDYLPDVSSPVAYKEFVFFTTSYGDMVCINQKDGALLWHHEFDNGFYGSPVIADGKLFCVDRTGATAIVEATGEFKQIGTPQLGEKSDATPAFADGMIYIRGVNNLYCIGRK